MQSFNHKAAIAAWRRELINSGGDDAFIEELESGLHDRYDEYLLKGMPPAEAFALAKEKVGNLPALAVAEYNKANRSGRASLVYLLPSYLKTGLRTLRARPVFNLINYLCLTIGIVTAAIALLYLRAELQYDAITPNVSAKYRLGMNFRSQGYSMIGFPDYGSTAAEEQKRRATSLMELPGIISAVQFQSFPNQQLVKIGERAFPVTDILQTNTPETFSPFFGWDFLQGSQAGFARTPYTAALTVTEAERFFGPNWKDKNIVGQALMIDTVTYTIAGILPNPARNTHFNFSIALNQDRIDYWGSRLYVETSASETTTSLKQTIDKNFNILNARMAQDELFSGAVVQPIRDIHLNSDLLYELKPPGKPAYLYIIGIIALLVLLLTISNYTNLSVAMNSGRSREIAMRKVFGAGDEQIASQFILESCLLSLLSIPLVMVILYSILPQFDLLMGTGLAADGLQSPLLWGMVGVVTFAVGLLAGLYPALYLSRQRILGLFHPSLKPAGNSTISPRKVIVTLQFALLIGLCSLTIFVNRQLHFMQNKDLGFNREQVLYVNVNADSSRFATFRNEVLQLPSVTKVGSGTPMGQQPYNQLTYKLQGKSEVFDDANNVYMDYNALSLLGIQTSIPEWVEQPEEAPSRLVLINSTLANRLKNQYGLTDASLIGQTILQEPEYVDEETGQVGFPYEIRGTFADVNMFSLRNQVDPMFMTVFRNPRYVYWAAIRYTEDDPATILTQVRNVYDQMNLDPIFNYEFLEDNLEELYQEETRIGSLSTYFSFIAFGLALIGLIALTAYLTTLRQREIGIRQILGASQWSILRLYNYEYLPLIGIALLIAAPLSWFAVNKWLASFAYRISMEPWTFLIATGITLFVTVLAVSTMTYLATLAIPANSTAS